MSSEGHPEQSAPIRARSRALIGGLCEDTAPQRTPALTDRAIHSNRGIGPALETQSSNARSCARMRSVIPQITCP